MSVRSLAFIFLTNERLHFKNRVVEFYTLLMYLHWPVSTVEA